MIRNAIYNLTVELFYTFNDHPWLYAICALICIAGGIDLLAEMFAFDPTTYRPLVEVSK